MTLYKNVDGERFEMSSKEEALVRAEWSANGAKVIPPTPDPDLEGAMRLIAIGHSNQNAIEALLNRVK